jgi:hypothetical protein
VWKYLQGERDVAAARFEMRVAGDEERPRVTGSECEQHVILESRQPEGLVVREYARE